MCGWKLPSTSKEQWVWLRFGTTLVSSLRLQSSHNAMWLLTFSNTWTVKFQMFKLVLEKAEEPEIKLPTSAESLKRQENSRKASISALLTMPKPLTLWITTNCGKFLKMWEYQTTWPASWDTYMQVRKQQLERTWNNRLVPNRKRSTSRLYIVTLLI